MKILLFGGTSEGRLLGEWLSAQKIDYLMCVATSYGAGMLDISACVSVGRLDEAEMIKLMKQDFTLVVDATHPYATEASKTIAAACRHTSLRYLRLVREGAGEACKDGEDCKDGLVVRVKNTQEACRHLETLPGNILLTTGSKDLFEYRSFVHRLYPRVLPCLSSLQACLENTISPKQIICMQGPFSQEMNEVILREFNIAIMVTKSSGEVGGFLQKLRAAKNCGCISIVINRPCEEYGLSLGEIQQLLIEERC